MPLEPISGVFFQGFASNDVFRRDLRWLDKLHGGSEAPAPSVAYQSWVRYNDALRYWEVSHDNVTFYPLDEYIPRDCKFYGMLIPPAPSDPLSGRMYYDSTLNKLMFSENGGAFIPVGVGVGQIFGLTKVAGIIDFDPVINPFFWDDFIYNTTNFVPTASGANNSSTKGNNVDVANHPGTWQLRSGNTNAGWAGIVNGFGTSAVVENIANILRYKAVLQSAALTGANNVIIVGFFDSASAIAPNGIYFRAIVGTTNWQCICGSGGVFTTVDSGVAALVANWFEFEIINNGSSISFYINGNLVATISTNIPSVALEDGATMVITTAVLAVILLDLIRITYQPISSRHT